jgi:predicted cupin superfamily sugar epimerase
MSVEALIRRYRLTPHPEGGWYRELHRSPEPVSRADGQCRPALTTILFLLPQGEISRWHRVSGADESWHHAGGAPLELLCLPPNGGELHRLHLATLPPLPVSPQQEMAMPVAVVPAGWWQAARSLGDWSLVSCCVGPGFDFADFTLLRHLHPAQHPGGALPDFL